MPFYCRECSKCASFGHEIGGGAFFCGAHRKDGMIDVIRRRCVCGAIARYSIDQQPTHCRQCKTDEMLNHQAIRSFEQRKRRRMQDTSLETKLTDILATVRNRDPYLIRRNPSCTPHDITMERLMEMWERQGGRCAISGLQMTHTCRPEDPHNHNVSLDRINSNINYKRENVHLVCAIINRMKTDLPLEAFITLCTSVVAHTV